MAPTEEVDGDQSYADCTKVRWKILALVVFFWLYLALGAIVFPLLEYENEQNSIEEFEVLIEIFLNKHPCLDLAEVLQIQSDVSDAYNQGGKGIISVIYNETIESVWDFPNALSFVSTIPTTIGYGHNTPKTVTGRVSCVIFGIVGIPLLTAITVKCSAAFTKAVKRLYRFRKSKWKKKINLAELPAVMKCIFVFWIFLIVVLCIIFLPAIYFKLTNDWTFLESVYAVFITATTIGFGDFPLLGSCENNDFTCHSLMTLINISFSIITLGIIDAVYMYTIGNQMETGLKQHDHTTFILKKLSHKKQKMSATARRNSRLSELQEQYIKKEENEDSVDTTVD